MVTKDQVKRGLSRYVDTEITAKLPVGTVKKVLVGTAISLFMGNIEKNIEHLSAHPLVKTLGIIDEHGHYDVDRLAEEIKRNMSDEGMKFDIDVLGMHVGEMTFRRSDVDTLRNYIAS